MLVDLMTTRSSDGIRLDGAFFAPAAGKAPAGPVDAALLLHGSGGNFYRASTVNMAEDLRNQGYGALALNTRSHDTVWINDSDRQFYGNAFEILDNTRKDIRAGVDYLANLGYRRIAILGHSMGAVRVGYYAALESDPRVVTVIPVSPVRLSYSYYMQSKDAAEFRGVIEKCDQMEAEGRALDLIRVKFPITQMFSAFSYLDKHGPSEKYNLVTLAPRIRIPLLVIQGELETHTRLIDAGPDMVTAAANSPRAECVIVPGGNHSLNNRRQEASATVLRWLGSLRGAPVAV